MKEKEIIDNYRDLPFGKYEEIVRLCETEMTDLDRKVAVISVLTGKTEEEVLHLPLETFTRYSAATRFLEEQCPENLIRELRNYTWAKDRDGRLTDQPIDTFNHALDAMRYALFSEVAGTEGEGQYTIGFRNKPRPKNPITGRYERERNHR